MGWKVVAEAGSATDGGPEGNEEMVSVSGHMMPGDLEGPMSSSLRSGKRESLGVT